MEIPSSFPDRMVEADNSVGIRSVVAVERPLWHSALSGRMPGAARIALKRRLSHVQVGHEVDLKLEFYSLIFLRRYKLQSYGNLKSESGINLPWTNVWKQHPILFILILHSHGIRQTVRSLLDDNIFLL